ncbi:MAG: ABC transporter permease, partial [Clostridia bacterium]|nr:ABC transporter permease [Clostridia bacterium]
MLKVDFKRMFTMPLVYIMAGVSLALPILILVMTSFMGGGGEGEEAGAMFTNVWQALGSVSGSGMSMDLTSMCNINLLYFLVAVFVCVFVGDDFKSGYVKNLFTVRSKKIDYVFSKSLVTFVGATIMFLAYFIGAMIGGAIAGLPFDTVGFSAGGVVACLFSKIFMTAIFVGVGLLLGVVGKQKLWLSILGSFGVGMLLFTMIPM